MLPVLGKLKGLLRLLSDWRSGIGLDAPYWGYWSAARWHSIALTNHIRHYLGLPPRITPMELTVSGCEHPIWLRPRTSDYSVFRQVFAELEYANFESKMEEPFVLDCGANVGLASVYFLNRFENCRVLAIEPDPDNAACCRRNLQKYGARASVVEGGVWNRRTDLVVVPSEFGAGNTWGIAVRPREPDDLGLVTVEAFDVPSLMELAGAGRIDILKVDIERSELAVFGSSTDGWLNKVRNIVIELHGEDCSDVFFSALERFDYQLSHRGDLTYCLDIEQLAPDAIAARKDAAADAPRLCRPGERG